MDIHNLDCFEYFKKQKDKSIDLFVLDLPYTTTNWGKTTSCKWDTPIDLDKMWIEIKRIMKPNAVIVFFCNTKFGYNIIQSNPKWFRYDLIWKKSKKVGFLSANKMPLRQHENIYVFSKDNKNDLEIERNKELRQYAEKILKYTKKTKKQIEKEFGNRNVEHFFYINSSQFAIPLKKNYEKLTKLYNLDKMDGYLNYEKLKKKWEVENKITYNSQKTEGKPYKPTRKTHDCVYGTIKPTNQENKGDRHSTSILEYAEDHENIYIFKKEQGTYNSQKTGGKPYKEKEINDYKNKIITTQPKNVGTPYGTIGELFDCGSRHDAKGILPRHPTSILEYAEDHENIYIFKKEQGTYNSQKTEGKPYHIKAEGDLKGYYREGEKNFKRSTKENKGERHPTSILEYAEDHENIYIFKKEQGKYNPQKTEGKPYNKKQSNQTDIYGMNDKEKVITENKGDRHPISILEYAEDHDNIYIFKEKQGTYNPQMEEGEPYEIKKGLCNNEIYNNGINFIRTPLKNTGTRYACSILEFNNPPKSIHRTQKPVDLLEWIIKSYSNEGDLICDFTFGSGSVPISCLNTKRKFTGCERDKDIFKIAKERIENHNVEEFKKKQEESKKKLIKKKIKEYKKFIEKFDI